MALGDVLPELVPAHHAEVAVRYLVVARRTPHRAAILRQALAREGDPLLHYFSAAGQTMR